MLVQLAESTLRTRYGEYREVLFYDGRQELIVMILGVVSGQEDVLCRVHSSCLHGHYFNSLECDCQAQMELAQRLIQAAGRGVIVWLDQEGKGNGHLALLQSIAYKKQGIKQADAYQAAGFRSDTRDFGPAAQALQLVGVKSVRMITDNPNKTDILRQHGIEVVGVHSAKCDIG
jgi:GTP cyclohydrolase II